VAPATAPGSGLILVIDDAGAIQTAMQSLLESWGYSVITAGSYDETPWNVVTRPERPGADHLRLTLAR
jgi:two-component system, sensor histidine kinase